jgi:hypothetical protein
MTRNKSDGNSSAPEILGETLLGRYKVSHFWECETKSHQVSLERAKLLTQGFLSVAKQLRNRLPIGHTGCAD